MPPQKLTKFQGTLWFQCLQTGVLIKRCYAYPDHDKYMRRKNGGSFADAACALTWLGKSKESGKISLKKYNDIVSFMAQELEGELVEAPDMEPSKPFFDYRSEFPWMYPEEDFLSVETVLEWKSQDSERRGKRKRKMPWVLQTQGLRNWELEADQFPLRMNCLVHLVPGGVCLEDMDTPLLPGKYGNQRVSELTGLEGVERDALLVLSKKPPEEGSSSSGSEEPAVNDGSCIFGRPKKRQRKAS